MSELVTPTPYAVNLYPSDFLRLLHRGSDLHCAAICWAIRQNAYTEVRRQVSNLICNS